MNILILEDNADRQRQFRKNNIGHSVIVVDNAKEAIELLKSQTWDLLCLDHDLGGTQNVASGDGTGWEVARFLAENPQNKPANVVLHSLNGPGVQNMQAELPEAFVAPFCWTQPMFAEKE